MTPMIRALPVALAIFAGVAGAQTSSDATLQGGRQPATMQAERGQMVQRLQQGLWRIAKTRIGLTEEQKELAGFMTPLQRAKFAALQEQLRRRVQALQQQRGNQCGGGAAPVGQGG